MIQKTLAIILALIFLLLKKIFIRENRVPNKIMDNLSDKLHSVFLFTSFPILFLLWFDLKIDDFKINPVLYILLFLHIIIIIRYFNPKMLVVKKTQSSILTTVTKLGLVLFILNWIVFSFGFAVSFFLILLVNNIFYRFIINQIKRQKQQAEFRQQFGEQFSQGNYSKEDIASKHILNLFEEKREISKITKSDIKKQYRIMAKKYHPDVYKGDEKDKFVSINASYKFLNDFVK